VDRCNLFDPVVYRKVAELGKGKIAGKFEIRAPEI
jgi:hypothetical protein